MQPAVKDDNTHASDISTAIWLAQQSRRGHTTDCQLTVKHCWGDKGMMTFSYYDAAACDIGSRLPEYGD